MPTALITGATAGIGAAFANQLAAAGNDVVLVARDADRLAEAAAELAGQHGVDAQTLPADLTSSVGLAVVEDRLAATDRPIHTLINNAGIGLRHSFIRNSLEDEERVLDLNVRAVMRLTHAALPGMIDRREGAVINISSVAGFGPIATGSTYPASKAWVTAFSEAMWLLARSHGVAVMALCPGFVRTEFHQRAGIPTTGIDRRMWLEADDVVRTGLADLRKGKAVSVPDGRYKIAAGLLRHVPRPLLMRALRRAER